MKKVSTITISEFESILANAKNGGQFVSVECDCPIRLNRYPTDGGVRVKLDSSFTPHIRFIVEYHFAQDYERTMAHSIGGQYHAHDSNRRHLIHNVLMEFVSTHNRCLIYMPCYRRDVAITLRGKSLSEEEKMYMARYLPKKDDDAQLQYRTISLGHIIAMTIGGVRYEIAQNAVA